MVQGWQHFLHVIQQCDNDCDYRMSQCGRINVPVLPSRWHLTWVFFVWLLCSPSLTPTPHLISSNLSFSMTFPNWNILILESFPLSSLIQICMGILAISWIFWGLYWRWMWKPHADISYSSFSGTCLPISLCSWHCCSLLGESGKEGSDPRGFWKRTWLVLLPSVI